MKKHVMHLMFVLLIVPSLADPIRYVIASAPDSGGLFYWRQLNSLNTEPPDAASASTSNLPVPTDIPQALITSGLKSPMGLAVDQARNLLYVADPTERVIYKYPLVATAASLTVGKQAVAVRNVEARWLAVDGVGNLFFSDESMNLIREAKASQLRGGEVQDPVNVYDGSEVSQVSQPGGIAVDNFRVFWGNKASGTQVGSVEQGFERPPQSDRLKVTPIALNSKKVYGVCLSSNNVFYTEEKTYIYGTKKFGGAIAVVNDQLVEPRGCVWDGDGTIYVADKGGDVVYGFPSNMQSLSPQKLLTAFKITGPVSVAVVTTSAAGVHLAVAALLACVFL